MRNKIMAMVILVLLLVAAAAVNIFTPDIDYEDPRYFPASDTVTASDPNWPTPEEQAGGLEALQELTEK